MQIRPKKPIIKERVGTWKAKGKPSQKVKAKTKPGFLGTVVSGAKIIGGKLGSGLKSVATAENAQELGDWGRSTGEFMESRSFGYTVALRQKKKKRTNKRKRK
jgi:hypothetical protein